MSKGAIRICSAVPGVLDLLPPQWRPDLVQLKPKRRRSRP